MNSFPSSPVPQYPFEEQFQDKVLVSDFESGKEQRRLIWSFPKRHLSLRFNALSQSDIDILWFFYRRRGTPGKILERDDPFWFFYPYQMDYVSEYVGQGDNSTRAFEMPGKSIVNDASLVVYVDGTEPTNAVWLYNGGFEQGDFTSWTQNSSAIDTGTVRTGTYSCKLVAAGSDIDGAKSDVILVDSSQDNQRVYLIDSYHNISSYTAGTYKLLVLFYEDETGTTPATPASAVIFSKSAVTSGWEQGYKSIGPVNISTDIDFPTGTKSIRLQQLCDGTPTLTGYMDDLDITIEGYSKGYVLLPGFGDGGADKVYFQYENTPATGLLIVTDFTGLFRLKARFAQQRLSRSLFTSMLYTTGIPLIEVK